jgi:hypothetical protein
VPSIFSGFARLQKKLKKMKKNLFFYFTQIIFVGRREIRACQKVWITRNGAVFSRGNWPRLGIAPLFFLIYRT